VDSAIGARPNWTREHPLLIAVGPEGGFEPDEERALDASGARAASLAPHILRIETAAIAALAVILDRIGKPRMDT
jgi:16S rRNA (uracil1498-N3)-methyltransferase